MTGYESKEKVMTMTRHKSSKRFHDLDALRSYAMLLGILLHAIFWEKVIGQSPTTSNHFDVYTLVFDFIHGFRMPLFILLSGFFTAMIWRRQGIAKLLLRRFRRVLLPLMVFTPVVGFLSMLGWVVNPNIDVYLTVKSNNSEQLAAFFEKHDMNKAIFAGLTPLQLAARKGCPESARWLIASGADLRVANTERDTALDLARKQGFVEIEKLLVAAGAPALTTETGYKAPPLMNIDFGHLWFLWFLWLLIIGFVVVALPVERISPPRPPAWLIRRPFCYMWLIPLTLVFQTHMFERWGPETFTSVFVPPYLLCYYAVFFGFGALYYNHTSEDRVDTHHWLLDLCIASFVVFPLGIVLSYMQLASKIWIDLLTVSFAWFMIFGSIGFFRSFCSLDNRKVRYASDASYFLYIMHMPFLLLLSNVMAHYTIPGWLKIFIMCTVTTAALLFIYEHLVRHRWIGHWLNGPRGGTREHT